MAPAAQTEDSDLTLLTEAIRQRLWVVALCVLAAVAAAAALTVRAENKYEAGGALLVSASASVDPERAMETSLQLLSLQVISDGAAKRLPGVDGSEVRSAISIDQDGDSDIIEVTAIATSPGKAARIANAFIAEFLAFRVAADPERFEEGRIELIERATPSPDRVSPNPPRNVVVGIVVGLVLGLGLALLLDQLDRRIRREEDLSDVTGLPRLAAVPKRESFDGEHLGHSPLSPAETEVFRMLRANLRYFNVERQIKSVLVTSAEPGEGKTLVSLGLALAAVSSGERVLLLEADMRDPGLTRVLGLPTTGGLSWVLTDSGAGSLAEAVTEVRAGELADAVGEAVLDVVPAGAIPPNPTELIESERMRKLLADAEEAYDLVVIDTPPVLAVSDAVPLIMSVSGVLAVSGLGVSTRAVAADLAERLERLGAPTLGVVANFADPGGRAYEGYGYGRPPQLGAKPPAEKPQ